MGVDRVEPGQKTAPEPIEVADQVANRGAQVALGVGLVHKILTAASKKPQFRSLQPALRHSLFGVSTVVSSVALTYNACRSLGRLIDGTSEDRWADSLMFGGALCGYLTIVAQLTGLNPQVRALVAFTGLALDAVDLGHVGMKWQEGQVTTEDLLLQAGLTLLFWDPPAAKSPKKKPPSSRRPKTVSRKRTKKAGPQGNLSRKKPAKGRKNPRARRAKPPVVNQSPAPPVAAPPPVAAAPPPAYQGPWLRLTAWLAGRTRVAPQAGHGADPQIRNLGLIHTLTEENGPRILEQIRTSGKDVGLGRRPWNIVCLVTDGQLEVRVADAWHPDAQKIFLEPHPWDNRNPPQKRVRFEEGVKHVQVAADNPCIFAGTIREAEGQAPSAKTLILSNDSGTYGREINITPEKIQAVKAVLARRFGIPDDWIEFKHHQT